MELFESILDEPVESFAETQGEPLESYVLDRPGLMLTFLDMAERYTDGRSPGFRKG